MNDVAKPDTRSSGRFLLAFVIGVDILAIGAVLQLPLVDLQRAPLTLFLMLAISALTGFRPIHIHPLRTTVSASDPFLLASIAALGGIPALLVGLISILSSMIGAKMRFDATRTPFNFAAAAVSITAASWIFESLVSGTSVLSQVLPLAAATTVYFLINSILVSIAISIERKSSFVSTWARTSLWTAATIYCAMTLAVALLFVMEVAGPAALVLGVPPLWLFIAYYRSRRDHLREQQNRMDQILESNQRLEEEVRARTAQLAAKVDELERARNHLRELAHTDELTLLANRRRFQHYLAREHSRSKRFDHPYSLLLIDIDHFKKVNDNFGHPMGDLVLQQLAALLEENVRSTDLAARHGGEEFAIVLAETTLSGGLKLADQLCRLVGEHVFGAGDGLGPGRITISIGVASFPEDADALDELVSTADQRLYRAKEAGRNRAVACGFVGETG
ncbi:MAG: diguanylate cyclase [Acidobacteriota bacterium]|nr:diguanylate cyclase [Acidobacteriota bacterium]MDH3786373.1 diguanylate cyclase [Acidobacteriota bacterium]